MTIEKKLSLNPIARNKFLNAHYGLVGAHSGVEICGWTKKSLRGKGVCYKQKFYGVDCHRCCQMSPALAWCQESCIFCWRPMEWMRKTKVSKEKVDDPEEIIKGCVEERKKLVSGMKGAHDADKRLCEESFSKFPSHWAISLSGEPTIYPKLDELIKKLRENKNVRSIFLVTNGQEPKMLEKLSKKDSLPTQLYVSVDAANREMFGKVNRSILKDGWERLNKTLELLAKLKCRRVIRFTLIKGLNDDEKMVEEYAKTFEKSKADFVEIKGYMFLGESRKRLKFENMPMHEYVVDWSKKFEKHLKNYSWESEDRLSRIVLFKRKDSKYENVIRDARG